MSESRWKLRFLNFEKAFRFFEMIVEKESLTSIEISGLVQAFEFTFELGWKTAKDYLYEQGVETSFPRQVIKEAYRTNIIEDGHTWMEMLEKRNELSHTYDEEVAEKAADIVIHKYFFALEQLYLYFKSKYND